MKRLRVLLVSLLVLVIVAAGLPATVSIAKWSRRSASSYRKSLRHKRHSRAWWRRYRARQRARRERALMLRRARARQLAARAAHEPPAAAPAAAGAVNTSLLSFPSHNRAEAAPARATTSRLPFEFKQPYNWRAAQKASARGETVFAVMADDGRRAGTAVLAPVSVAADAGGSAKAKTIGGSSVSALRRTVIDRMVAEGGWVTNDYVREFSGRRVFVVLAQTGAPGAPAQSWAFYFTELDGRVYSLATNSPVGLAAPLAAGSEQFMASLRSAGAANLATQK